MESTNEFLASIEQRAHQEPTRFPFAKMLEDGSFETYSYSKIVERENFYDTLLKKYAGKICGVYHVLDLDLLGFILAAFNNHVKLVIRRTTLNNGDELHHDIREVMQTVPLDMVFITPSIHLKEGIEEIRGFWLLINSCDAIDSNYNGEEYDYIQFSSGSTGTPHAFCLTLEGLLASADYIRQDHNVRKDSVIFSYLTLSHIYGFCTGFMLPLLVNAQCVLTDTSIIKANPLTLFKVIESCKVTHAAVVIATIKDALQLQKVRRKHIDLSSIYCMSMGGEKVDYAMVSSITQELAQYGVRKQALVNSYGMSEKGAVAMEKPDIGNTTYCYNGNVCLAVGPTTRLDVKLKIFDSSFKQVPDDIQGFVGIASPYLAHFYFESRNLLPMQLSISDGVGFYLNGDLGFCHNGKVYITGRTARTVVYNGLKVAGERLDSFAEEFLNEQGCKLKRCFFFNIPGKINKVVCLIDSNDVINNKCKEALQNIIHKEFHIFIFEFFITSCIETGIGKVSVPNVINAYLREKRNNI
jgi:acyl-CoA synthetase (AMP-forming)/AMP-acid ligase II